MEWTHADLLRTAILSLGTFFAKRVRKGKGRPGRMRSDMFVTFKQQQKPLLHLHIAEYTLKQDLGDYHKLVHKFLQ